MPLFIKRFKLSVIWSETILDLLEDNTPSAPMAFLARDYKYGPRFADAIKEQIAMRQANLRPSGELAPPWPAPVGHHFWMYYLRKRTLDDVSGQKAWEALVPFRVRPPFKVQAAAPIDRVLSEGYAYPHGFAWVLTMECSGAFSPDQFVDTAQNLRRTTQFTVRRSGGSEQYSPEVLTSKALQWLRTAIFGSSVSAGTPLSVDPFTVLTVLQATGNEAETCVQPNGIVHRILEAVSKWRPTRIGDTPPELSTVDIGRFRQSPESGGDPPRGSARRIIYGRERGRAVWFSDSFLPPAPGEREYHLLGCYHRNLMFASLQGESLLGLLAVTAQANDRLPNWQDKCAKNAARRVGWLYGGVRWTYRTSSLRAQVEQQDLGKTVNAVRARYGMAPLS